MDHCDPIEILLDRLEEDLGPQLLARRDYLDQQRRAQEAFAALSPDLPPQQQRLLLIWEEASNAMADIAQRHLAREAILLARRLWG